MNRYFLRLAYDGTRYHGWQRQRNALSVQQTLEEAMSMMLRDTVKLTGAGRTDTGVHAKEYFAHFNFNREIRKPELQKLLFNLNSYLDPDIVIYNIFPVSEHSHARFSASSRTYKYYITTRKNPFRNHFTHFLFGKIDVDLMNMAAEIIRQNDDFTSFSKVDTDTKTNICKVYRAFWEWEGEELVFTITANRFLRNMVRSIVGTLLDIGTGKMSLTELKRVIESKNRANAGDSVPACGLFLYSIDYPGLSHIFDIHTGIF